ncbi:ABC transporter ATP-binding protein [Desulfovibrio litoralis]|uniref:Oligopeptide transport system ATP-binding protein n=1 Tax=Desulfovibrio litoralis DSM 11393 TaxID=1121455 RepID=A0A1M7SAN0_9BACT|nr:ABC transporter ATP-binding protein [Desulfovibrio litoralis]SHN55551.1 oligopeptide transport system ATP-binding protein [Desulfovibrio litoralis DSM 11393]
MNTQQNFENDKKSEKLLEIKNLNINFKTKEGLIQAVRNFSLSLDKGKTLCLVGESGCGKSVTALSILRLLPSPPTEIKSGQIFFEGQDILTLNTKELLTIRGKKISMIFQDPMNSLNPVLTIGEQISEILRLHLGMSQKQAKQRSIELLSEVGIAEAERRYNAYPHELSGGMRQRVMIAMAIGCKPQLIIADEPTTALDVTMQKQILGLLKKLASENNSALLLITHDLSVVAEMADDVLIMYLGEAFEYAKVAELFNSPNHPYTQGLLRSRPAMAESLDTDSAIDKALKLVNKESVLNLQSSKERKSKRLPTILGSVPSLLNLPSGCTFHPRCTKALPQCSEIKPEFLPIKDNPSRFNRCLLTQKND